MLDLIDNWVMNLLASDHKHAHSPKLGDHIFVPRNLARDLEKVTDWEDTIPEPHMVLSSLIGYTHHGIYIGDNKVIHYDGEPGREDDAEIKITSLENFAAGDPVNLYSDESDFTPGEIVARAHYRLGEKKYSVGSNNCQHFCNWCRGDRSDDCYYPEVDMATVMKKFRNAHDATFSMQLSGYQILDGGIVLSGTISSGSISVGDTVKVIQQPRKGHLSEVTHPNDEEIAVLTVTKLKKNKSCRTARSGDSIEMTVDGFVSCINMFNYLIVSA